MLCFCLREGFSFAEDLLAEVDLGFGRFSDNTLLIINDDGGIGSSAGTVAKGSGLFVNNESGA